MSNPSGKEYRTAWVPESSGFDQRVAGMYTEIGTSVLLPAIRKAEAAYRELQPDAEPGECWAEIEALWGYVPFRLLRETK